MCASTDPAPPPTTVHTDPEMPQASDLADEEPISLRHGHARPTRCSDPISFPICAARDRRHLTAPRAIAGRLVCGRSDGSFDRLGYLVLTLRELSGLSQSRLAARARTSQPAIARLESGRHVPSVNTLLKIASACGMHLVVGLADPELDVADLCMHDLTLLGILRPSSDDLPDFFVIREPPP